MIADVAHSDTKRWLMSPTAPIVFVVDDDISVRESLAGLIRYAGWQVEAFASAQEFLACPATPVPSCLLLDVGLPDLNGLDLQKRVALDRISMPIIFITGFGDIATTVRAMKAGAVEFLVKPLRQELLLAAIRNALAQSKTLIGQQSALAKLQARYASLSGREREVMTLVTAGKLNKLIGAELGISEITVKAHRGRVMRKMGASSLADLVRIAASLQLGSNENGSIKPPAQLSNSNFP
jgi:FixJ family two-component response regulator